MEAKGGAERFRLLACLPPFRLRVIVQLNFSRSFSMRAARLQGFPVTTSTFPIETGIILDIK